MRRMLQTSFCARRWVRRHCAKFLQAESVSLGHKCDPRGFPSLCMCIYLLLHTHVSSTDQKFQEIWFLHTVSHMVLSSQRTCDFQHLKIPRGPKNHQNLKILVSIFSQFWWRVPLIKNTRGTLSCTDDHNKGFSWWSNFWGGVNQHFSLPLFWHWRSTARGLSCICILKTNHCTMSWLCSKMTLTVFWIPQCSLLSNSKWLRILLSVLLSQNERCHCTIG